MNQQELILIGLIRGPDVVKKEDMKNVTSGKEAILECIRQRRVKYCMAEIAARLEINRGHWSKILKGNAHFPLQKLPILMSLCGNTIPLQWLLQNTKLDQSAVIEMFQQVAA